MGAENAPLGGAGEETRAAFRRTVERACPKIDYEEEASTRVLSDEEQAAFRRQMVESRAARELAAGSNRSSLVRRLKAAARAADATHDTPTTYLDPAALREKLASESGICSCNGVADPKCPKHGSDAAS